MNESIIKSLRSTHFLMRFRENVHKTDFKLILYLCGFPLYMYNDSEILRRL